MKPPKKILVIRNDKLGDFMLAWPAFSLLKHQYPNSQITALVPEYTAAMAELCPWIDDILIDNKQASAFKDIAKLSKQIKTQHYDMAICFYLEARTAISLRLADVKQRVGPATKIAQIYLNKTLRQRRSQSIKPEYEYNVDLARYAIELSKGKPTEPHKGPFLTFNNNDIDEHRKTLYKKHPATEQKLLVIIHPGTGGSAINLSLSQYAELALVINNNSNIYIVITAGPGEHENAKKLSHLIKQCDHHIHFSNDGITSFCKFIAISEVFISGSTGPLHIAGALDVCTAAFYPARRSATSLRWQTLNSENRRLAFSPEEYTGENDMQKINVRHAAEKIVECFIKN